MRTKFAAAVFACVVSVAAAVSPFAVWQIFLGDPVYDSVFSNSLGGLAVMRAGRVMPVSSAAADILKSVSKKNSAKAGGHKISAVKWLWLVNAKPNEAALQKTLCTDNRDLQILLSADGRYYSYDSFVKNYETLEKSARGDSVYAAACADAINSGLEYAAVSSAFGVRFDGSESAVKSLDGWRAAVASAAGEFGSAKLEKRPINESKLVAANEYLQRLRHGAEFESGDGSLRAIPARGGFETYTAAMLDRDLPADGKNVLALYARLNDAVAAGDGAKILALSADIRAAVAKTGGVNMFKVRVENFANALDPFFGGFILYGLALAAFGASLLFKGKSEILWTAAAVFLAFAAFEHAFGICARMYIQGRPPVTNLYSSVVFTGAVAGVVGLFAYLKRGTVSFAAAASATGFLSLLVAMNLPYSGDTMGMMRAVLNSNFWLTIHVVTIMVGYCGVFLAGFMAGIRLVANLFSRSNFGMLTAETARGAYGALCFALLFSFAGTMLGGIWADMSWGRFWGWDPKENGALMVVLWTAACIHCRALKICGDRVFLSMAVFGNVVAAWAWFGVNLMGVGLHAYGFIDGGWKWFFAFVISQLLILPLCFVKFKEPPPEGGK